MIHELKFRAGFSEEVLDVFPLHSISRIDFVRKHIYVDYPNFLQKFDFDPETGNIFENNGKIIGHCDQYIGLKDKKECEIYEGDIIRRYTHRGNIEWGYVYWDDISFEVKRLLTTEEINQFEWIGWPGEYFDDCEVIGNIYENPEILKAS